MYVVRRGCGFKSLCERNRRPVLACLGWHCFSSVYVNARRMKDILSDKIVPFESEFFSFSTVILSSMMASLTEASSSDIILSFYSFLVL